MAADLELRDVPSRVLVRRPLDVTKLSLIRGVVVVNVERQFDCQCLSAVRPKSTMVLLTLQELVPLVPVNLSVEAEEGSRVLLQ